MKLIVGLGNPGRVYGGKRHNVGFMSLRHLARQYNISFDKNKGLARIGRGRIGEHEVVLARPQTFMNLSGSSVARLKKAFNAGLDDIIIIHDDLDLPLGTIRIRSGGTSGGHRGVQSIIAELGSAGFIRIKIGIGRPEDTARGVEARQAEVVGHVLGDFSPAEKRTISQVMARVGQVVVSILTDGPAAAMNSFNQSFTGG